MHRDCEVCRAEGFAALTRVLVECGGRELVATLNVVTGDCLTPDVAALSEAAWASLDPGPEARAVFSHPDPPASAGALRAKVFGVPLSERDFHRLMRDTVANRLSDIELAAFVTACAGDRLDHAETIALTRAMVSVGERIDWSHHPVLDKHGVGGLPGNRTTPIVVAIVAAAGHCIPKTSSRAITSPAGTADAMEVMAPVALDLDAMRRVVEREGGCIVWGGSVHLSPADDVLIRVERPLDFDSDGQLVASVLSKKAAAGASHVLIDIPVGPTAKVRSVEAAASLEARFVAAARALGLTLIARQTDGRQPVGYGIGPALEARDVLHVLHGNPAGPRDLRARALDLAGTLLDAAPGAESGGGRARAQGLLDSGAALRKFLAICDAQGGFREPQPAPFTHPVLANRRGRVAAVDNRQLARIAKLAGAPGRASAGVDCRARLGSLVDAGQPLFHVHAHTRGELAYALRYAAAHPEPFVIEAERP
jgi:thymidine phosphorylase